MKKEREQKIKQLANRDMMTMLKPKSEVIGIETIVGGKRYTIKNNETGKKKTIDVFSKK